MLSIVVPIYKVSEYLEECLESIVNQSLRDIEIILVNDCSPDNNDELICSKYIEKDSRIKYIKHEKNKGLGEARNSGIKVATGKYIAFVDSDDYLVDMHIYEKAINILENNDNINFVGFNYVIKLDGKFIHYNLELDLEYEKEEHEINISKPITSIAVWNKVFRLKDINDNNILFRLAVVEDLMYNIEYFYKVKPIYKFLNEDGYMYRIRKGSIFVTQDIKKFIPSYLKILDYVNSIGLYNELHDYFYKIFLESYFYDYFESYLIDDNFCCTEDYIKLINYIHIESQELTRLIYRKLKYRIIVDNKEKFQKLFPYYRVRSKFYYKLHRVFYFAFKGLLFKNK